LLGFVGVGVVFGTLIPTNTVAGTRLPNESRASAFGLAQGALYFAEGGGAAVGGIIASVWSVRTACVGAMAVVLLGGLVYTATVPDDDRAVGASERTPPAPPPQRVPEIRTPPAPPPRPIEAS
jgi:predicted MFS family arabinose efflux permease